jgi:hypothetical protein
MVNELLKILSEKFREQEGITSISSFDDVVNVFEKFSKKVESGDLIAKEIANILYEILCSPESFEDKGAPTKFEDFLAKFLGGERVRKENRENLTAKREIEEIDFPVYNKEDFKERVKRNRLEKVDVVINGVVLSIKTLVPENKEINIGSFSAEALFGGFVSPIPNEREKLGSKPALLQIFKEIKKEGKWNDFRKKFEFMVDEIFFPDLVVCIRYPKEKIELYFINANDFKLLLKNSLESPKEAIKVLNRFEAHALRLERDKILEKAKVITLYLSASPLDSILKKIKKIYVDFLVGKIDLTNATKKLRKVYKKLTSIFEKPRA